MGGVGWGVMLAGAWVMEELSVRSLQALAKQLSCWKSLALGKVGVKGF